MTQLAWEIPTLTDLVISIAFGFLPVIFLVSIICKIFLRQLVRTHFKINIYASLLSPIILVISWSILSNQPLILLVNLFISQFVFFFISYSVIFLVIFAFLFILDKILLLRKEVIYILAPIIILLFCFLFPKKINKTYQSNNYIETTSCTCVGFNTKPTNLTSQYNSCLGILITCTTRREYCGEIGCPVDL